MVCGLRSIESKAPDGPDRPEVSVNGLGPILGMRIRVRDQWSWS